MEKRRKSNILTILLFFALIFSLNFTLAAFSGSGSGTKADPWQIISWAQLAETRDNLAGNYTLMNDLSSSDTGFEDYAKSTANGGSGWLPIGNSTNEFTGTFEGQNHTVSDAHISFAWISGRGFFGYIGEGSMVSNLKVFNISVYRDWSVGGLVGRSNYGTIINCHTSGIVESGGTAGGIVGMNNYGKVINCSSSVNVSYGVQIGGLVGYNNRNLAEIINSYATGYIEGTNNVGGLVGINYYSAKITNSYATGDVIGNDEVGGLIGRDIGDSTTNSYSTGSVTNNSGEGGGMVGLSGDAWSDPDYVNCFWDTETSGWDTSDGGTGKTTAEMQSIETFSAWDIVEKSSYDDEVWYIDDGVDYPRLGWEYEEEASPVGISSHLIFKSESPSSHITFKDIFRLIFRA